MTYVWYPTIDFDFGKLCILRKNCFNLKIQQRRETARNGLRFPVLSGHVDPNTRELQFFLSLPLCESVTDQWPSRWSEWEAPASSACYFSGSLWPPSSLLTRKGTESLTAMDERESSTGKTLWWRQLHLSPSPLILMQGTVTYSLQ